jgi:2-dehydro-3-deoxygluconokinase
VSEGYARDYDEGYDVVCVGEAMTLLAPDPPRPLREGGPLRVDVAGAESNVAIYLATLGVRVAWSGRLGRDPLGQLCTDRLAAAGVDVRLVATDTAAPTGVFFKDPGPDGTAVYYYRRGSAASAMGRAVWSDPRLAGASIIHLSGITPALSPACADLVGYALADRPVPGALMSFDVNYRPGLWPAAQAAPVLAALAGDADLVFVGRDEAATLWGTDHPDQLRDRLPGPPTVVVKDGAVGATSYRPDGTTFEPAPPVAVVEPVGAGDGFAAGYLFGVLRKLPERTRLRLGHLVAGAALRVAGDIGPVPPAAELLRAAGEDGA